MTSHEITIAWKIYKEVREMEVYGTKPEYLVSLLLKSESPDPDLIAHHALLKARYLEAWPQLKEWID